MVNADRSEPIQAVDAVCNLRTPETAGNRDHAYRLFSEHFGTEESVLTIDELVSKMDENDIEKAFLIAVKRGSKYFGFEDLTIQYEVVHEAIQTYPDRFYGLAGIDPWEGMEGVRALEHAVEELGFVGAHVYPHWFYRPPHDQKYYPFYTKCAELGIPIQMQVGHCLIYLEDHPPMPSVGRPRYLDRIACDFPELKLVGIHTGYPWVDEMISVSYKHPNVYIGTDAYAPTHWPTELVDYIDGWGSDKVIFGTDWPVLSMERARGEIEELGLKPENERKLLRENVARVYDLDL
jgi:predicted TIM-barrel fold metal-dependent hydrolase